MNKGIGFIRTIHLPWLDAAAAFCGETGDQAVVRERLEPIVGQDLKGTEAQRKTIDVLVGIWLKSQPLAPALYARAIDHFQNTQVPGDRLWLHYGLTLVYFDFFRACVAAVGQFGRLGETVTNKLVKQRLVSARGHLGSLDRAVERVVASLRDWGVLTASDKRHTYVPARQAFSASSAELEAWLLACALFAHPAQELPFADLLRLPELFPFRFTLGVDYLRQHPWFAVQRQGSGWEMVRLIVEQNVE